MSIINTTVNISLNTILIGFFIVFIIGIFLSIYLKAIYKKTKTKMNFKKGEQGEIKAKRILEKQGYKILHSQPETFAYIWIDGHMKKLSIRADYLVSKSGRQYICEVKTGKVAGDITYRYTRRQLLEYYLYFELPVIFVDVINENINKVEFAMPE